MDKPLQLLRRVNGDRWRQIELTKRGHDLANADDPAAVVEDVLAAMRFAVEPWSPPQRVKKYSEFDVYVYEIMQQILDTCDGYIDRNEFDFFVSRIRSDAEVSWADEAIRAYRKLTESEKESLHHEVRSRIPGAKEYSNWRDVGLHTFSLFSLGTSMVRHDTRLLLTRAWVKKRAAYRRAGGRAASAGPPPKGSLSALLRMPTPPEAERLLAPPTAPVGNDGADAESFVAKVLRSQGWKVAFYTNRRGYGFDLWARRQQRAMLVEVKSSLGDLNAVSLTPTEYRSAREHGDNYFLALVEHIASASPKLWFIQNPVARLTVKKRNATSYVINRAEWLRLTR